MVLGRGMLEQLRTGNFMVQHRLNACLRSRYFKVMDTELPLSMSAMGPVEKDESDLYAAQSIPAVTW